GRDRDTATDEAQAPAETPEAVTQDAPGEARERGERGRGGRDRDRDHGGKDHRDRGGRERGDRGGRERGDRGRDRVVGMGDHLPDFIALSFEERRGGPAGRPASEDPDEAAEEHSENLATGTPGPDVATEAEAEVEVEAEAPKPKRTRRRKKADTDSDTGPETAETSADS
ncbi:hypothetical protein HKCCSP123_19625, partial [Rhodobacterales bacterium HKCCSP123]|nr:hypothetical protein [Rhodobacterales bacterium HKCCSP123]